MQNTVSGPHRSSTTRAPDGPLVSLDQALDALYDTDPSLCCSAESIIALEHARARLDCYTSKAVAEFDQWGEWGNDGAKTSVAWLDTRCHLPKSEARQQRRRGANMKYLPLATEAWSRGDIGAAQFDVLVKLVTAQNQDALARDESILVDAARDLKFQPFCAVAAYWELHSNPDGAEEADMDKVNRRDAYLAKSMDGMWMGGMTLDPISGAIVSRELSRLEAGLFQADWAKAKEELGREPKLHELARTPSQRRADSYVEMATRSASAPADARRPEPLFSVLVGYEELHGRICQLAEGPVLSPGSLLPYMDGAEFERIIFRPGARVECSIISRFFTGATRRAIEVRDQQCTDPYCDEPADRCQIDHIESYVDGGETTQENGRVMCGFHNRLRARKPPPDD